MVLNAAAQVLREAEELKEKVLKCNSGTSMLQDRSLWVTQQQLQKAYHKVLTLDLDYALEKKVEQDLWNVGFKQQIEALQAIAKDRKNAQRSEAQAMLSWVLQMAAGSYLCLLHQICTTYKLDLPFRRRASLVGAVEGWEASTGGITMNTSAGVAAARYACQHCLVHLGDLARYRQQLKVAHTFYRHALAVSAHSGQPYNQLALVAWRRGRRLAAVYWHVRSLLVRAPFPPAPANLARTLAAAAGRDVKEATPLPVLSGQPVADSKLAVSSSKARLDAHAYVSELLRALHCLHTVEHLDSAEEIVNTLNSSLSPLIATDSFDSLTLIKMVCVIIWIVHATTEDLSLEAASLTEAEGRAAALASELAAATVLALLLPAYCADRPHPRVLPPLKIFLQWIVCNPKVVSSSGWKGRPQIWAALAHVLNKMADTASLYDDKFELSPLPEDEELNGFLPLEGALRGLRFAAAGPAQLPDDTGAEAGAGAGALCGDAELEQRVRARRLRALARQLAHLLPEHIAYTEDEDSIVFTANEVGGEQLTEALESLSLAQADCTVEPEHEAGPPPPIIISEADFREKVREKRVGILKPQGSLERAREERALATALPDSEEVSENTKVGIEDKKEIRKPRVNIAMAAIMRKQEESNKQVKFVTPPPTPDSTGDASDAKDEPKVIQPKPIKSLANIPIGGRKTGGILSLKDKSAGYPHLVNAEPETKKAEKEEKKDPKPAPTNQNPPKRQEPWNTQQNFTDAQRNYQKNYGIQNSGISYNPSYQAPSSHGIRLPVVNPKEIDVRTAALQKQNSRQEMFQDGHKFTNYQVSGDKKNFLNDLPPRFANQYRYWQAAQESQTNENKFRDENFKANPLQRQNWPEQSYQQMSWWKPEQPTFNANFTPQPMNIPNFYSQMPSTIGNPYQNVSFNQIPGQNIQNVAQNMHSLAQNAQSIQKSDNLVPNYLQSSVSQPMPTLQNVISAPNYNSSLNSLTYNPSVGYDSSLYPQFGKFGYQPVPMLDKPGFSSSKEPNVGLGFGANPLQQRGLGFNETFDHETIKPLDNIRVGAGGADGSTYSLFSGAPDAAPAHLPAQSLWSGPGSPLERLLEQQKQNKHPPAPR